MQMKNNLNLSQWEKRVLIFKFIYSLLINEELDNKDKIDKLSVEIGDDEYINLVVRDFILNENKYIDMVSNFLLKTWKISRVDYIDRAIIFSAIGEYRIHKIDKKILIDQAIITSKKYGVDNSYKFINFILDKVLV